MADTIIQKITIEGGKEIEAALKSMGQTGENAFKKINTAAHEVKAGSGIDDLATSTSQAGDAAAGSSAKLSKLAGVMDLFGASSKEAAHDAKGLSNSAADAISGISGFGSSSDQAGAAVGATDVGIIRLSQTLRLLSKAVGIRPLGQFARTLGILGRAAQLASPALFLSFSEKIASSASKAADAVADAAAKNKVSLESFQDFGSAFSGIGAGAEEAGKSFSSLKDVIKETASNTDSNAKNFAQLADSVKQAEQHVQDLGLQFADLEREGRFAARDFNRSMEEIRRSSSQAATTFAESVAEIAKERDKLNRPDKVTENAPSLLGLSPQQSKFVQDQFAKRQAEQAQLDAANDKRIAKQEALAALDERSRKAQEQLGEESRKSIQAQLKLQEEFAEGARKRAEALIKLNREQEEADKKVRETHRAQQQARIEAERNATALEKLGIRAIDANGKLKKVPAVMDDIAEALHAVTDEEKRETLENELVAAGIDRHMLPALRRGKEGFAALKAEGKRITPPFSKQDVEIADDFLITIGQVTHSITTLKNIFGLNVAPSFAGFFERLTEIFIGLQDPVRNFGFFVGKFLTPLLDGLASSFGILVDGIGGAINAFTKLINTVFGSNLESAQVFAGVLLAIFLIFAGLPTKIILLISAIGLLFDKITNALGLKEFGKQVLSTLIVVGLAFTFFGARIIGIFIGIRLFISALIGSFLPFAPVLAVIGLAALALFAIWKNWDVLKDPVMKAFEDIKQAAEKFWADFKTGWTNFVKTVAPLWDLLVVGAKVAFEGLQLIFDNVLVPVFEGIKKGFLALVDFINEVSGKKFTPTTVAIGVFIGILTALALAFAPVTTAIIAIIAVGAFLLGLFKDNNIALAALAIVIGGLLFLFAPWTTAIAAVVIAVGFLISKWDVFKKSISDIMDSVKAKLNEFAQYLAETWFGRISIAIARAIGLFNGVSVAASKLPGSVTPREPEGNPFQGIIQIDDSTIQRARGGSVWGRGTSTSDSIPAWLSDGEFVTKTRAVNYYGRSFMHAINDMRLPKDLFRGFSLGGLVEGMAFPGRTHFATGGVVPQALHPVNLHLPSGQVITGLQANDHVVKVLTRASVARQMASTGRKPSYYGKGRV